MGIDLLKNNLSPLHIMPMFKKKKKTYVSIVIIVTRGNSDTHPTMHVSIYTAYFFLLTHISFRAVSYILDFDRSEEFQK